MSGAPPPSHRPTTGAGARGARIARTFGVVAAVALSALGIGIVQPRMGVTTKKVRQRDDVFLLPPPKELRAMSLGYHAAAADMLWSKLLVEYGLHAQERRAFPDVTRYIDGILALEPTFAPLYKFVDTILIFTPNGKAGPAEARLARAYLERGTRELPYDANVWMGYGQFSAFLAPSFLEDEAEIDRWRVEGAQAIMHAVELGGDAQRSLSAASILNKAGERKATIEHLRRAYAMTDDVDAREQILRKLNALEASSEAADATSVVEREWRMNYGFLSRSATLLVGPKRDPAACAGPSSYEREGCARDWRGAIAERNP